MRKMSKWGVVTILAKFRKILGWKPGEKLKFELFPTRAIRVTREALNKLQDGG